MTQLYGIEQIAEAKAEEFRRDVLMEATCGFPTGSPIEHIFYIALWARGLRALGGHFSKELLGLNKLPDPVEKDVLYIQMQKVIINEWPVDFLLTLRGEHDVQLVVECDGHDFHERTKAQAARDRSRDRELQSIGLMVLRFTGSELFTKPVECANETYRILYKQAYGWEIRP